MGTDCRTTRTLTMDMRISLLCMARIAEIVAMSQLWFTQLQRKMRRKIKVIKQPVSNPKHML